VWLHGARISWHMLDHPIDPDDVGKSSELPTDDPGEEIRKPSERSEPKVATSYEAGCVICVGTPCRCPD